MIKHYDAILEKLAYFDWEDYLTEYGISIKRDGDYVLLRYNDLGAPFEYRFVRECRGSIFKFENGAWKCVCAPFVKFFNYGEANAADIDWASARVTEKVDGSLMKIWYDGEWHLSTNGTIDAFKVKTTDDTSTFGDVFVAALEKYCGHPIDFQEFCNSQFEVGFTYMFELTSPETRVVIDYPLDIYYLGRRNMKTMAEDTMDFSLIFKRPRTYDLSNLDEVLGAAAVLPKDKEGFVVYDKYFNRIKVKGTEYLAMAHIRGNGVITPRKMVELWQAGMLDDLIGCSPQYTNRVIKMLNKILGLTDSMESAWRNGKRHFDFYLNEDEKTKKAFAALIKSMGALQKAYCFARFDNKVENAAQFLKKISADKLLKEI